MSEGSGLTAAAAFLRYEAVRARLPQARFPAVSEQVQSLADVADRFDAFVLDAFGVLNVGEVAIDGAVARMAEFRALGKRLIVLTNAASHSRAAAAGFGTVLITDHGLFAGQDVGPYVQRSGIRPDVIARTT